MKCYEIRKVDQNETTLIVHSDKEGDELNQVFLDKLAEYVKEYEENHKFSYIPYPPLKLRKSIKIVELHRDGRVLRGGDKYLMENHLTLYYAGGGKRLNYRVKKMEATNDNK